MREDATHDLRHGGRQLAAASRHLDKRTTYRGIEEHVTLEFRWAALNELAALNVRPTFLRTSLLADPLRFSHAVQREYD